MSFVNASTGWAVANGGIILATTNGGATWAGQTSGTANNLYAVSFASATTGWAVGTVGTILATTNGGATWTAQTSGTANDLYAVSFVSASTGWATGAKGAGNGTILATTNGGTTWAAQASGTANNLYAVSFVSATTGWATGVSGTILATTNGGTTWIGQTSGTTNEFDGVSFVNASTGWAVGANGTIRATTNAGTTWIGQNSGTTNELWGVGFTNAGAGWAVGASGTILAYSNPPSAIANVQNGPDVFNGTTNTSVTGTLPVASTAGTLLVAAVGHNSGSATLFAAPGGWIRAVHDLLAGEGESEIWYYPNNPGGIVSATFTTASTSYTGAEISEWSGVATTSPLDQTGATQCPANVASCPIATAGAVAIPGELAISEVVDGSASSTLLGLV